jgi:hypothetical protein
MVDSNSTSYGVAGKKLPQPSGATSTAHPSCATSTAQPSCATSTAHPSCATSTGGRTRRCRDGGVRRGSVRRRRDGGVRRGSVRRRRDGGVRRARSDPKASIATPRGGTSCCRTDVQAWAFSKATASKIDVWCLRGSSLAATSPPPATSSLPLQGMDPVAFIRNGGSHRRLPRWPPWSAGSLGGFPPVTQRGLGALVS